ncbi:MAG: PIG-L family deacetylase [Planctomycetes bacterium]|nr:PIG-L family deacetylase [Planctomycetota bacterium]
MSELPPEPALWRAPPNGRVLAFAPHPDDEVAGPGGTLALHAQQGDPVRVVVSTDGTNGDPDGRHPHDYAALRRRESQAGMRVLGLDDAVYWGFPDGFELSEQDLRLGVDKALAELRAFAPDVVYLPWQRDGHPDHHALHVVVTRALDQLDRDVLALGYEVWNAMIPDVIVDITATAEHKRRALRAHESQTDYVKIDVTLLGLAAYRSQVHLKGEGYGEAFQLVRGQLPEGSQPG